MGLAEDLLDEHRRRYIGRETDVEAWDVPAFRQEVDPRLRLRAGGLRRHRLRRQARDEIRDATWARIKADYEQKEALVGRELLQRVERDIMLQIVDGQWKDHLYSLDHLKEGIGLRGYGQRDPLVEYKRESFELFQAMRRASTKTSSATSGGCARCSATRAPAAARPSGSRRRAGRRRRSDPNAPSRPVGSPRGPQPRPRPNPFAPRPARTGGDDAR